MTESYGADKLLDLYRPNRGEDLPVVLFWHGRGPNERNAMAPLAKKVAHLGVLALVPDWQSDDSVMGRENLLSSLSFAQTHAQEFGGNPARISLCGWSLGADAAADILLHPGVTHGWRPNAFVGLAGGYGEAPISGGLIVDGMVNDADVPCLLVHGTRDEVVRPDRSRDSHEALRSWGWQSTLREVDADHAGILGTRYERDLGRCFPSEEPSRLRAVDLVAHWVFEHIDFA